MNCIRLPKAPPYLEWNNGTLYLRIRKNGRRLQRSLLTKNVAIALCRVAPALLKMIKAGELDPRSRVCKLYLPGRCPRCGRPFPGGK